MSSEKKVTLRRNGEEEPGEGWEGRCRGEVKAEVYVWIEGMGLVDGTGGYGTKWTWKWSHGDKEKGRGTLLQVKVGVCTIEVNSVTIVITSNVLFICNAVGLCKMWIMEVTKVRSNNLYMCECSSSVVSCLQGKKDVLSGVVCSPYCNASFSWSALVSLHPKRYE